MRYARFEYKGVTCEGSVEDSVILPIADSPFQKLTPLQPEVDQPRAAKYSVNIKDVRLLAPVIPSKIIAVGLNYLDHAEEFNPSKNGEGSITALPEVPLIFLKPASAVIGPNDAIYYPKQSARVDYEAELAIVIRRRGRNISSRDAKNYIFGYTCLNDVTARDLQKKDGQWTRAKSFDTFCPIGPHIVTDLDVSSLKIESILNGKVRQSSNTSKMIFNCEKLVEFISGVMTLEAGDIIATGTPGGIGPMTVGDEIEVRIENIGSLINRVL
jgi:2-keto-4-pentenoate hydratase/2-oxohepta-3-ene-1,7-dioic acid hydratase in catechol pathway